MKKGFSGLVFFILSTVVFGQIFITPPFAHFGWIESKTVDSVSVEMSNDSNSDLVVDSVFSSSSQFWTDLKAFDIPANSSKSIMVYFKGNQNVDFLDYLIFSSSSHIDLPVFQVSASVFFPNTYYDQTQNLYDEDLKQALNTIINTGFNSISYNSARDAMYMTIDNQKVNGQNASTNTLECVYTGRLAVGYSDRQDAQNNHNFNTEHTFPQAFFSSAAPMKSDLHHIFPTDANSNSVRANKPFGLVSSPTWNEGGSKSDAAKFEPRDNQKCSSAGAILYFVTMYGDYAGFGESQESILRQWMKDYAPGAIEKKRNDDVFSAQGNRNPFIDYPEFLERIKNLAQTGHGPSDPKAHFTPNLYFTESIEYQKDTGYIYIANTGKGDDLSLAGFTFSNPAFSLLGTQPSIVSKDSFVTLAVVLDRGDGDVVYSGELFIQSNDPDKPLFTIDLNGSGLESNGSQISDQMTISPNPADEYINLNNPSGQEAVFKLFNVEGKVVLEGTTNSANSKILVSQLEEGMYIVVLGNGKEQTVSKVLIGH